MKKIIPYILIIIVLAGIFSPMFRVNAQTPPTGTCSGGSVGGAVGGLSQSACTAAGGTSWDANTPGYQLLAPLPNPDNPNQPFSSFDPKATTNPLGTYLNLIIKLIIGISAVLAVVMIVIGGLQYMTSELISSKEEGKERIKDALLGLLIALGAWALLNTINPNLLNTNVNIPEATVKVTIDNFQIASSGPQSRYGTAITVDFNSQAYPAAVAAQTATGVDSALVLAIFNQETASGGSTGACFPAGANMTSADQTALASIVGPSNVATTHVSCSLAQGHGGAIGLTQFLPTTWNSISQKYNAPTILGHFPDPWNVNDALTMTALFLKDKGAATTDPALQRQAACNYFGACASSGVNYGDQVMAQAANIQKQIAVAKASGKIN